MTAIEIFRLVANEYADMTDAEVEKWIELCEPFVSKKIFGKFYYQALAYLAAHRMKMAGLGDASVGTVDGALRVGSYSEGGVSISYSVAGGANGASVDAELALTVYGLMFLEIRRLVIIPIRSAGECRV